MPSDPSGPESDGPPTADPTTPIPPVVARRAFLRSFSRDAANAAIQAAGVAVGLQRATGDAIGSALGLPVAPPAAAVEAPASPAGPDGAPSGTGATAPGADSSGAAVAAEAPARVQPYRVDGDALWIVDQRGDPRSATEHRCENLGDLSAAMHGRHVFGAPLLAELTAFGLWLVLVGVRGAAPQTKRTRIRTSGAVLRGARSNITTIDWAVGRMVAAWDAAVATTTDEAALEDAMLAAAIDVAGQMRADVVTAGARGAEAMPAAEGSAFGILTLGSSGYPGDPHGGGAAGIAGALVASGRPVRAWVLETRPVEDEARATARNLAAAGAETSVVSDAAAGWLLATRSIDAVLIGADRVALDGAVTSVIGAYGLAALARGHGVPGFAIATRSTIDREARDPADPGVEAEPSTMVDPRDPRTAAISGRVGSRGPLQDITPADLLDGIVTESGVLRPPFDAAISRLLEDPATPG